MISTPSSEQFLASLHLGSCATSDTNHWPIERPLIIGRQDADIEIQLNSLSRKHAEVEPLDATYVIRDLNSRNGTAVNGKMLDEAHALVHGDSILLAGAVEFFFFDPNATPHTPRLGALRGLWIDPKSQDVWIDAKRLTPPLSRKQFTLLQLIANANGELITRDTVAAEIWPNAAPDYVNNDAIDSIIKRLRRRLGTIENTRPVIEIIRGRGLRLISERDI